MQRAGYTRRHLPLRMRGGMRWGLGLCAECPSPRQVGAASSQHSKLSGSQHWISASNIAAGLWELWSCPSSCPQHARTPFPVEPRASDFRCRYGSAHAASCRLTLRSYGWRLRLGFRWLGGRQAGSGAHHGAGEGADRRGQRAGAAAEDDRQVLPEVHREAGGLLGQFGAEMHRHVHGPLHGRLEYRIPRLQLAAAARTSQHVTGRCWAWPNWWAAPTRVQFP